jgi:hypothetical protein
MANIFQQGYNYFFNRQSDSKEVISKNLSRYISPLQLERIRQDVGTWREAIREAESAYYPYRVKMQRIYQDTILNGHVFSCMERRNDLTLLRDFSIKIGEEDNDEWTKFLNDSWFHLWMAYGLDALAYGYQLVALGDLENNTFPNLTIIKRQNISPDRLNVTTLSYQNFGIQFLEEPYKDFHSYFKTPTENAASLCGYGYLYKVAIYEIYLRNLLGANADYVQTYGQPYRVGKTPKTQEAERAEMLEMLLSMGSSNAAVIDPEDSIEFISSAGGGSNVDSYDNLELRLEKKVSKVILGHADAMDSTAGKLGSEQGEDSPVAKALRDKKTKDGSYIENMVNGDLLPKLRDLGFNIPMDAVFSFKNDEEKEELREREDKSNAATAIIMKTISDAGGEPDWKYFSDRTGIKVEKKEAEPIESPEEKAASANNVIANMKNMWRK